MILDQIRNALPGETIYDKGESASVTGLHVRVLADGSKSFLLYYRTKFGKARRPKIGTFGAMTLAEARKAAKTILEKVAVGEDPKATWDQKRAERTVDDLFQEVWENHWNQERFKRSEWARQVESLYRMYIKNSFGSEPLSNVTTFQIREWHQKHKNKPYNANRAFRVLSKMFSYAEEIGWRPNYSNPCHHIKQHVEKKRKRFATESEMAALGKILERDAESHPREVAFLYLLIYSGSRPSAIERATWDQLQLFGDYGVLTLAGKTTEKTGEEETIVLPPQAMRVLSKLPRESETITGIKRPRNYWERIREEADCKDLRVRDWRRTFATVGLSNGVPIGSIGELLNHRTTQTTKIYARLLETQKFKAVTEIADRMEKLISHSNRNEVGETG